MTILTFEEFLDADFIDEKVDPEVAKKRAKAQRDFLKSKKLGDKRPEIAPYKKPGALERYDDRQDSGLKR